MSFGAIAGILMAIVSVAGLFVLVTHTQTASIIKALGDAFSGALKSAMGN